MTTDCGSCAIAEIRINGVVHSRRNCRREALTSCHAINCACDGVTPLDPAEYANIMHKKWVDLPAGLNTIEAWGLRIGQSSVESLIEVAVWRKECPPMTINVICIPASVIAEQGLCEFERLAALHGTMVGCLEISANCQQGPEVYQDGPECLPMSPVLDSCEPYDPPNPGGGVLMNTVTFNYPYETRVQIEWETAFVQNAEIAPCECVA